MPAKPRPTRRAALRFFTPPKAITGIADLRAIWLARKSPSGSRALMLRVGNTGLSTHASAPHAVARATASALCADAVKSPGPSRAWSRASGQCTPSAPTRCANSGSAAISRIKPRELQTPRNRRATCARLAAPKWRYTTAVPRGSRLATSTGLGVRVGSVKKNSDGMGGPPASRLSRRASAASW